MRKTGLLFNSARMLLAVGLSLIVVLYYLKTLTHAL